MWTLNFWKQTAERAIKAVAVVLSAFFVVGQTDLTALNWGVVLSGAGVAAIASVLLSLMSAPFGQPDSPSLVRVGS
jgi:hypothetical protein